MYSVIIKDDFGNEVDITKQFRQDRPCTPMDLYDMAELDMCENCGQSNVMYKMEYREHLNCPALLCQECKQLPDSSLTPGGVSFIIKHG